MTLKVTIHYVQDGQNHLPTGAALSPTQVKWYHWTAQFSLSQLMSVVSGIFCWQEHHTLSSSVGSGMTDKTSDDIGHVYHFQVTLVTSIFQRIVVPLKVIHSKMHCWEEFFWPKHHLLMSKQQNRSTLHQISNEHLHLNLIIIRMVFLQVETSVIFCRQKILLPTDSPIVLSL